MLVEFTLDGCGLALPAADSGVQHTLRRLCLSSNDRLEIDQAGSDTRLVLRVLQKPDSIRSWRSRWSQKKMQLFQRVILKVANFVPWTEFLV